MHIGRTARRLLGPRLFAVAGAAYRRIFVDLNKVADAIGTLPDHAHILDIGGGDGVLLDLVLQRNRDVRVTLVDASTGVGGQIRPEFRDRVEILGGVSLADYARRSGSEPDVVLVMDVLHHVLPSERPRFFEDLRDILAGRGCRLVCKDMEPGYFRTTLGGWADRYISGDPNVVFPSREDLRALVQQVFAQARCTETALFEVDRPNYCLVFDIPAAPAR